MSIDEIRTKAAASHKRIKRRNLREYVAEALVVIMFTGYAIVFHGFMVRLGSILCIPGAFFITWFLQRRGSASPVPAELGLSSGISFYRRELERQREVLRWFWLWNLAPFVPGLAVMLAGFGLDLRYLAIAVVLILAFWSFLWWGNIRAARKLQREIDELQLMEE
ncbi:MAG TPA: hypothetical protein VGL53_20385 [Bryobacteraceae bacterium]|jgi:hypothetical protein